MRKNGWFMDQWPHAPLHIFDAAGTYMITGATYNKELFFKTPAELDILHNFLLELAQKYHWNLQAWAVFPNHYHFVAQSPMSVESLSKFISHLHTASARALNILHNTPGRKVWHQYWDSRITFQTSYLSRLNYVIQNPVKHGLVQNPVLYKWCSASWFEMKAEPALFNSVISFKTDQVNVRDNF